MKVTLSQRSFMTGALTALIITSSLLVFSVIHANWSAPPSSPPGGNVSAPINTSNSSQFKASGGEIGADRLTARTQVQSDRYCNQAGTECIDFSDLGGGGGTGGHQDCQVTDYEYICAGSGCGWSGYVYTADFDLIHGQFGNLPPPGSLTLAEAWNFCQNYHDLVRGSVQCLDGSIVRIQYPQCVYTGGP